MELHFQSAEGRGVELVQNVVARLLMSSSYRGHIKSVLAELQWLPVHFWILFETLAINLKAFNGGLGPGCYFHVCCPLSEMALWGSVTLSRGKRQVGMGPFCIVAPQLWSSLQYSRGTCLFWKAFRLFLKLALPLLILHFCFLFILLLLLTAAGC